MNSIVRLAHELIYKIQYFTNRIMIGGSLYYLKSHNNLYASARKEIDFVRATDIDDANKIPIMMFIPNFSPDVAYLFSSRGWNSLFNIYPNSEPDMIRPLRKHDIGPKTFSLMDALSLRYLSNNLSSGSAHGTLLALDRKSVGDWEIFTLERSGRRVTSPSMRHIFRSINRISRELTNERAYYNRLDWHPKRIADSSSLFRYDFDILNICQHLIGKAQVDELADAAMRGKLPPRQRYQHDAEDLWYSRVIPDLLSAASAGSASSNGTRIVGHEYDRLDTDGAEGNYISLSHKIACRIRSKFSASKTICLVATARNEGPYLIDWVAYHKAIGFENIFIYSNDNNDGSDEILRILADHGVIVWIQNHVAEGRKAQTKAYGHAFSVLPDILDYTYAAIIDLDEYIVLDPNKFSSIIEFAAFHERVGSDVIHLNWNIMSSSGHLTYTRLPVVDRFDKRLAYDDHHTKCIVRTSRCMHSTPHFPILHRDTDVKHCDAEGVEFEFGPEPSLSARSIRSPACVNHYFYKSLDEYISKFTRNRGDYKLVKGNEIGEMPDKFRKNFGWQFRTEHCEVDKCARTGAPYLNRYAAQLWDFPGMNLAVTTTEEWHSHRARTAGLSLRDFDLAEDAPDIAKTGRDYSL